MGLIEQISQMKERGLSEREISEKLQEQGIAPKNIMEALEQTQIKEAVTKNEETQQTNQIQEQNNYNPQNQDNIMEEEYAPQQEEYPQEYPQEYAQQEYPQQEYYGGEVSTEKIIEVSEQVFNEKIKKLQQKVEDLIEFKTINQSKIDMMSNRLRKLESTIDQLQAAILRKIGSYGGTLESIKDEMSMIRDSFSAVAKKKKRKTTKKKTKKK